MALVPFKASDPRLAPLDDIAYPVRSGPSQTSAEVVQPTSSSSSQTNWQILVSNASTRVDSRVMLEQTIMLKVLVQVGNPHSAIPDPLVDPTWNDGYFDVNPPGGIIGTPIAPQGSVVGVQAFPAARMMQNAVVKIDETVINSEPATVIGVVLTGTAEDELPRTCAHKRSPLAHVDNEGRTGPEAGGRTQAYIKAQYAQDADIINTCIPAQTTSLSELVANAISSKYLGDQQAGFSLTPCDAAGNPLAVAGAGPFETSTYADTVPANGAFPSAAVTMSFYKSTGQCFISSANAGNCLVNSVDPVAGTASIQYQTRQTVVNFLVTTLEPLMCAPFQWRTTDRKSSFFNMKQINVSVNWRDPTHNGAAILKLGRNVVTAPTGVVVTTLENGTISGGTGPASNPLPVQNILLAGEVVCQPWMSAIATYWDGTFKTQNLRIMNLTLTQPERIAYEGRDCVMPYQIFQRNVTSVPSVNPTSLYALTGLDTSGVTATSQTLMVTGVFDFLLVAIRYGQNRTSGLGSDYVPSMNPDTFLPISNLNITFNTSPGLCANWNQQQLYDMSVANGSNQTWAEFCGRIFIDGRTVPSAGSVVFIRPCDLNLPLDLAAGLPGQYQLQVTATYTNYLNRTIVNPQMELYTCKAGWLIQNANSVGRLRETPLSKDQVVALNTEVGGVGSGQRVAQYVGGMYARA